MPFTPPALETLEPEQSLGGFTPPPLDSLEPDSNQKQFVPPPISALEPSYDTQLSAAEEERFRLWKKKVAPNDSGEDYDLRGAFKAGLTPDPASGHWPDTFKKPNHPTFSDQSKYAADQPALAGHWNGEKFVPPPIRFESEKSPAPSSNRNPSPDGWHIQPGSLPDRIITWFAGGPEALQKAEADRSKPIPAERPPFAVPIARGIDTVAGKIGSILPVPEGAIQGQPKLTLRSMVEERTQEPKPEGPSFLSAGIPMIGPQEGTAAEIAAGVANVPIGFANFLLSPGGVATVSGLGLLPKLAQTLAGLGFTAEQAYAFINAETLQDRVTSGVGTALLGAGTALSARGPRSKPSSTAESATRLPESEIAAADGLTSSVIPSAVEGPRVIPPLRERKLTDEQRARLDYERELTESAREFQSATGDELLSAIADAGGLPSKNNPNAKPYAGELRDIEEAIRDPERAERISPNQIFRTDAPGIDQLATSLRDRGFNVSGPDEIFALVDQRIRSGREIFAQPESAEYFSPKPNERELLDLEGQAKDLVREFQGDYGATGQLLKQTSPTEARPQNAARQGPLQEVAQRTILRSEQLQQNRRALAEKIEALATEEEFTAEGITSRQARQYGRELTLDYAEGVRSGRLPSRPRYPIYRGDFKNRPFQYITAADHALRIVEESLATSGFRPKEDIYFSPRRRGRGGIPPIPPPAIPPGYVLTMGELPVTMPRTRPGAVSVPEVLDSLKRVMTTAGSVGEIRTGRFSHHAKGIFKSRSEVVRLEHINDIPTAVHEAGHALMKQVYGTVKSRGLKWTPSAVRRELIGLGKELYGDRKPTAGYTAEGFAEFLRLYLTTDGAGKLTPNTLRFFEEGVLKDHPAIAQQLAAARNLIHLYRTQGAFSRANTQLVREPSWTRRVLKSLREFFSRQKFVESALPLRDISREAARRTGRDLPPSADPYKLFKMKRGASGPILDRMVEQNMVDVWGNPTGPSLREAFAEVKSSRGEFLLYLFARRAEERWSKNINPGITKEDAAYIRQTLESPAFDRAAQKYYQWWDGVLDYLVQAAPQMADTVANIKKGSSDYAPLARMLDERAVRREAALAQSNPMHRMRGSGLPVKDIFDQTLMAAARLISRANRELVSNAIFKLSQIEGMGRMIEEVPIDRVRRQVNVEQIRTDLENMGLDTSMVPEQTILEYYSPADTPRGADPIIAQKDAVGATHWYHVDPKLYDTLNKIEPFSLRSIPHIGVVLDLALGVPKRIFTLGTTGLRPTFSLLTNPLRDPQAWLLQTKAGINPAKMLAAYLRAVGEQLRSTLGGKEGPISQAAFNLGPQMAQPLGRDIQYTKRAANSLFHGRFMRVISSPVDHIRQVLNLPESFPRLAEFQRVGQEIGWKPGEPMSPDQAVQLSIAFKEATVDFSAAGDASRIINEAVPFFNPNIQGARTAVRAFREHPLRTTLLGLGMLTGPTLANWWRNKDKEWYSNLPWRERYQYTNIDDGKNVWQIPRPFEWGNLFQVIPEAAIDSWYQQDPASLKAALGHIATTQNPFDFPVALKVAKEQWQNHIDFWDRPIVPRSEVDLPPGEQVGPYTTKLATWLGKSFPNTISPRRIDAGVRGAMGGAIPDLLDYLGLGTLKKTRESELSDAPIVGRLWRRGGFYNGQSQHLADFWDIKNGLDAKAQAFAMQAKDPSRAQGIPADPMIIMARRFNKAGKSITAALRLANQMRESDARQRLYKEAAREAEIAVELYRKQQENFGNQ